MARPARRAREIAHIREDILHAAAEALSRHGIEKATIHDIAREAGYTTTSLYAYFDGKQDIVETLLERLGEDVEAIFREAGPTPGIPFAARLELVLRRELDFAERWQAAFVVLGRMRVAEPSLPGRARDRGTGKDRYCELLTAWLRDSATAEELGGRDPHEAARVLESLSHAIVQHWLEGDRSQRLADSAPTIAAWFLRGAGGFLVPHSERAATPQRAVLRGH